MSWCRLAAGPVAGPTSEMVTGPGHSAHPATTALKVPNTSARKHGLKKPRRAAEEAIGSSIGGRLRCRVGW
ncbi:MAG TPA: hypothetical protein VGE74_13850 [Gemmata sp.]